MTGFPYTVTIVRKRGIKQKFHVRIVDGGNHETLFTSENYVTIGHAREIARTFSSLLHAEYRDET